MTEELRKIISKSDRYKTFTILDKPVCFDEWQKDNDIERVQIHLTQIINIGSYKDIIGFFGAFKWLDNQIISLDYTDHNPSMMVYGYEYFDVDGVLALDILVD